jgi:hypothetical protein
MKNILRLLFVALLIVGVTNPGKAEMFKGDRGNKGTRDLKQTTAGCTPSSAFEWLNINNVRTRINAGGDMWWDLPGGVGSQYYIPANGSATSLYAGSLWIAGVDINNQLKCAAVRFRQDGNDFWTGPLNLEGASIDDITCARWDQLFKITRAEVDEFLSHCDPVSGVFQPTEDYPAPPKSIAEWPAHPETVGGNISGVSHYMAPFFDRDGDGLYDYTQGDYPYYDIENELCHTKIPTMEEEHGGTVHGSILADQVLKGDQTLWWVFNDKGNSHTESNGAAIGLEVRAQAFAFSTNDEINNMSFCSYEIINRSTYELTGTFFCPWTDVDLGYAKDDYVGCDVARGLGYGYNGLDTDGSGEPEAYGNQPPAVGVDFFQGPYMDADGLDNPKYKYVINTTTNVVDGDTIIISDTISKEQICDASINGVNFGNGIVDDERFGMRRFLYHNNSSTALGDPDNAAETYLLLRSFWRDGNKMQFGGTGYPTGGNAAVGPACDFMFPGDTDPCNWGTGGVMPNGGYNVNGKYWNEKNEGNAPDDRRFMQSAGPFTLKPGAVNYITFGVPWARATSGGAWASVELLRVTDDKCQALFDNCFKVIDGPNAPDLTIRELDQKLIIYLSNSPISNNYREGYAEPDPQIPEIVPGDTLGTLADKYYRFEGYKVYQLANAEVGADELSDNSKARLVFQADIKNNVSTLVNYEWDNYIGGNVPALKVNGADGGITHSFVVTEDLFSTGESSALVNHKTYYFMAVAYAYNNYFPYSQEPADINGLYGQMKPYLEGRKNISCYTAVPHKVLNGTKVVAQYGDTPAIKRIVGQGNGGNEIELSQESIDELFAKKMANTVIVNKDGGEYDHITFGNPNADTLEKVVFGHPDYPIVYHPSYTIGKGPLAVKIIDPLNVKTHHYELWFDTLFPHYTHGVSSNQSVIGDSALRMASHWFLKDLDTDEVFESDTITVYSDEKLFLDRGISVSINQPFQIGAILVGSTHDATYGNRPQKEVVAPNNGMITSSLIFQDSTQHWLDGIRDVDVASSVLNWIRSGTYVDQDDTYNHDYNMTSSTGGISTAWDPHENYEKIANRTWAPYILTTVSNTAKNNPGPLPRDIFRDDSYFSRLSSIDIVFTSDRSKWTRCPVVEMCMDENLSQNGVKRFDIRRAPSIDKDGKPYDGVWDYTQNPDSLIKASDNPDDPNYIAAQGMGWFPGYVIDVESGMRLNLLYGEDSYLEDLNGRDLMFNPPALKKGTVEGTSEPELDPALFRQVDLEPVLGGKHFVYIWGLDRPTDVPTTPNFPYKDFNSPAYDGGKYLFTVLNAIQTAASNNLVTQYGKRLWRQCLWVGMPMRVEGFEWDKENNNWVPEGNDAKIRIRIAKPYDRGYSYVDLDSVYPGLDVNNQYPKFEFSIEGLDPVMNDPEKIESDLDLISVVPNPYYAYSSYEANALVNKVKITNLPNNCVVTIYNISGTKIRQFKKDNEEPSIEWDLTNFANTPVASGFYLIHVKDNASGGERTIKFFGAMRQIDLNTF